MCLVNPYCKNDKAVCFTSWWGLSGYLFTITVEKTSGMVGSIRFVTMIRGFVVLVIGKCKCGAGFEIGCVWEVRLASEWSLLVKEWT